MDVTWDRSVDAAYVHLIPPHERTRGVVANSVALDELATEAGVKALHSLVLDFDRDGPLIGIDVVDAQRVLRKSTLQAAR